MRYFYHIPVLTFSDNNVLMKRRCVNRFVKAFWGNDFAAVADDLDFGYFFFGIGSIDFKRNGASFGDVQLTAHDLTVRINL